MADGDLDVDIGRSQLKTGALAGVAAYVVGFLVMFLPGPIANPRVFPPDDVVNASINLTEQPALGDAEAPLTETADGFSSAGGLFYNAHFVDITVGVPRGTSLRFRTNVLLAEHANSSTAFGSLPGDEAEIVLAGLSIPPVVLFALPVVLLALGGYAVNRRTSDGLPTPETAVASGSVVALGYLPLVAIGAAMIRFRNPRILFGVVDVLGAIAIAGIVYPVAFGGLGGYAWHVVARRRDAGSDARETAPAGGSATPRESGQHSTRGGQTARGSAPGEPARPEQGGREASATTVQGGGPPGGTDRTSEPPATATTERVTMTDELAFEPETITITAGDTVRWENGGSLTFTVTAYEDTIPRGVGYFASGGFRSEAAAREAYPEGGIASGESYSHTFETPGVYEYFCVPQEDAGMIGTVEVRER